MIKMKCFSCFFLMLILVFASVTASAEEHPSGLVMKCLKFIIYCEQGSETV